jgi:hypothetical protein
MATEEASLKFFDREPAIRVVVELDDERGLREGTQAPIRGRILELGGAAPSENSRSSSYSGGITSEPSSDIKPWRLFSMNCPSASLNANVLVYRLGTTPALKRRDTPTCL